MAVTIPGLPSIPTFGGSQPTIFSTNRLRRIGQNSEAQNNGFTQNPGIPGGSGSGSSSAAPSGSVAPPVIASDIPIAGGRQAKNIFPTNTIGGFIGNTLWNLNPNSQRIEDRFEQVGQDFAGNVENAFANPRRNGQAPAGTVYGADGQPATAPPLLTDEREQAWRSRGFYIENVRNRLLEQDQGAANIPDEILNRYTPEHEKYAELIGSKAAYLTEADVRLLDEYSKSEDFNQADLMTALNETATDRWNENVAGQARDSAISGLEKADAAWDQTIQDMSNEFYNGEFYQDLIGKTREEYDAVGPEYVDRALSLAEDQIAPQVARNNVNMSVQLQTQSDVPQTSMAQTLAQDNAIAAMRARIGVATQAEQFRTDFNARSRQYYTEVASRSKDRFDASLLSARQTGINFDRMLTGLRGTPIFETTGFADVPALLRVLGQEKQAQSDLDQQESLPGQIGEGIGQVVVDGTLQLLTNGVYDLVA